MKFFPQLFQQISPMNWDKVVGQVAKRDYLRDEMIQID